ncbi:dihydropteroate synthase [Mucilaginibacter sp. KACC 22063]|uniref:dihydropteroate synthase n=1 Tax=Mucilaginibacter sp. KACC 22063 TaxID=3025666 RepID=UPI0023660BD2|nr:dihydropteroate synthase [Mucilaginibacter sp. KACC 22063]WDF54938.1 dihydropteroate synthase [Mucilaginibacter sp. KACC 22063]
MVKDTVFHKKTTLNAGGKLIDLSTPKVMGIINLTPDSFYSESRKPATDDAVKQAEQMISKGATFFDLGAYSSRPGAEDISVQEEMDRLLPVVEAISTALPDAILSIDTFRSAVAEAAIKAGAHIINDIGGGTLDEQMFATVARLQVPYILMHMKGTPQNMVQHAQYEDVFQEVFNDLEAKYFQLKKLGLHDVILDPGFGFAKKAEHSYALLNRLQDFNILGLPVLVGVSRKRMIYNLTGGAAADALNGTTVVNTIALMKGANILRVHDVKEAIEAVNITATIG